jgi:predicted amidohydrolase/GNAT superfamily N-acetyltransferase
MQKIELRNLLLSDYLELKESMIQAYKQWAEPYWREDQIETLLIKFPEGQLCVLVDDKVAGAALSIIVDYEKHGDEHTYISITGNYTFSTHTDDGDVLYGIDVFINPEFRGLRLGRRLYDARKELCERLNLRAMIAGGRIPGYKKLAEKMDPKEYIFKVKHKEIYDPVLTFQLSNDFHVTKILKGYLPDDQDSMEFATLLEWNNIYYTKNKAPLSSKEVVRLGLVQWQMRLFDSFDSLCEQIEFFVDAVSDYKSDFILFPEHFNAPLMAAFNHLPEVEAMRQLAGYTELLHQKFQEYAVAYNINIITGSMPLLRNGQMLNVGYFCRRNGSSEMYEKLHITPSEVSAWGMVGGDVLRCYESDAGRIGILICYDVEFPELGRLLAQEGMEILFVPFLTDTQSGYTRVRHCAQARAIENECYVAIAGCVGNLPKVHNMDIQYAQSAVFTPSDFSFPITGVVAEATPNTEMTLIVDVDLSLLKKLHTFGSVRNLKDIRNDLYEVKWKNGHRN